MVPEVVETLLGKRPSGRGALLYGYERRPVYGMIFPGIVPMPKGKVAGILYTGLSHTERRVFDWFESEFYEPRQVAVRTGDSCANAVAYVIRPEYVHILTEGTWDVAEFRKQHLDGFLGICREFVSEFGR